MIAFLYHNLLLVPLTMNEQQDETCDEEEYAIHDSEGEACLQHRACLIDIDAEGALAVETIWSETDVEGSIGAKIGAVGFRDSSEFVDASDEGADETEIDERDKYRGVSGGLAPEPSENGPHGGEDGDDEKDKDITRCELIFYIVTVHEICLSDVSDAFRSALVRREDSAYQHAQCRDQSENFEESPKGEEQPADHLDGPILIVRLWEWSNARRSW